MTKFTLLAAAIALATSATTAAQPQVQETASIRVATRDLNLTSAAGQRTLERRVARAASELCDTANERFDAKVRTAQRHCREQAISTALASARTKARLAAR